jgi:hypothetical protein
MRPVDRAAGLAGLAGVILVVLCSVVSAADAEPGDPTSTIAAAVIGNRDAARLAGYLGIIGAFLFGVFVARLYGHLRAGARSGAWVPVISLIGGCAVIGAAIIEIGMAFAASEVTLRSDPSAATFFVLWWWNPANLYAPGFAMLLAGGTAAQARGAFTLWFRWFSLAMLVLLGLLVVVAQAPGLGTGPGIVWVGVASIVLALSPAPLRE